jgi:bacillithiol biosynthesis cysteine-adding enzyme BshC
VKSECLPFSAVPHTSQLFQDYLYHFDRVRQFYRRPPVVAEWAKEEAAALHYDDERRRRVADALEKQNRAWGASPKSFASIARLRAGAAVAATGQQVALLGGPLFSLLKALTAVRIAEEATRAGVDCVPVFWLATEDHDLAEVNHATLLDAEGALVHLQTPSRGTANAPVSEVPLGAEIEPLVEQASRLLGDSEVSRLVRQAYRPRETLGSAFARLFAGIFADWGVILLDASDPELHAVAQPVYRAALLGAEDLDRALLERGAALRAAGYHEQVKVTPETTLLFEERNGARVVVHRTNGEYSVGLQRSSREELLARIVAAPERFSANVLLRPVVQDFLLPTIAYTGGPAEVAYFAQAAVVYQELLGRVTPVVPRFSATLLDARAQRLLAKYRLTLTDFFHGDEQTRELLALRSLPEDLQARFEGGEQAVAGSLEQIRQSLARLDPTLVEAAGRAGSKMLFQLRRLRKRAGLAQVRREQELDRHAAWLCSTLFPDKHLQERQIAGVSFLARHGLDLLHVLYEGARAGCPDHQIIYL